MGRLLCPICHEEFDPEAFSATLPFCGDRCRQIDLRRWLDEEYGLRRDRDEEAAQTQPDPD